MRILIVSVSARITRMKDHNRGMGSELVLAIFGPTASGKSAVAEEIARRFPAEVISADSMQVYRGLPLLTNQPQPPTALVAIWPLDHEGSVAEYQRLAHAAVDRTLAAGATPVVVGGTGLYLRAALSAMELPPPPQAGRREHWQDVYDRVGGERAYDLLADRDPAAAAALHPNDRRRVVRALELTDAGRSLKAAADALWSPETRHPTAIFGLEVAREELLRRIDARTRAMFEAGLKAEVAQALARPVSATARKALGLDEVASLPTEKAIEALNLRTRRYAAYQRKWMRRIPGLVSVAGDRPPGEVADEILEVVRARQRLPAGRG
jgi:tRNA dimethylallyltransferase